ncbi:MAG: acyl-CoA thioesterase [Bacteroidales bacterium]|nr:acyl-CoA thioesterase [Bacteroidales bacterium]
MDYIFKLPIQVRDYEVDAEGIVNNAEYLHYMEHTRHEFCKEAGCSFRQMHEQGLDPVATRIEVDYKSSLGLGDEMLSCLNIERKGPLFIFYQDIYKTDGTLVTKGVVKIACLDHGRLCRGDQLAEAFAKYL